MQSGASNNRIGTNADGVNDVAERNVISGNNWFGVEFLGAGTSGNVVQGNYIGTDSTGLVALGNAQGGVSFWNGASDNWLGSGLAGAGNVISGNATGVQLGNGVSDNRVQSNLIGLGADGSTVVGNTGVGVLVFGGGTAAAVNANLIGTDADGVNDANEGNVISSNFRGIALLNDVVSGTRIAGNLIGADATGTLDRGNISDGIYILDGANGTLVGGLQTQQANLIAFNGRNGIRVENNSSTANLFLGNSIHSNAALGINLVGGNEDVSGATANDAGDVDSGPNSLLNTMLLTRAVVNGTNLTFSGSYNGAANSYYRIEVYSDTTASGEGRTFLNAMNMAVGSSGSASMSFNFSDARLETGQYITVTATRTDASYSTFYETSEFSNTVVTATPDSAPVGQDRTITVTEDTTYTFSTADFPFTDADGNNLSQVWIESLPGAGTLYLNGVAVQEMDAISAAEIQAGKFTYTPAANGTAATSFLFSIIDSGSSYGGGLTLDTTANTLTINITAVNDAPVFSNLNDSPTFIENGSAVALDADVSIFDAELSGTDNFNGSTLTLARHGGANSEDALAFDGITVTVSGPNVYVGGVQVGTYSFSGGQMEITFGANATNARVNTLMRNTVYWNWSETPPASVQIDWTFSDVNNGAQGSGAALTTTGSTTVNITGVNDAPIINVVSARTTDEDIVKRFSAWIGNAITISDVDAGSSNLEMTISAINGTVTLGGLVGLTFSVGDGSADTTMTFRGTLAAINTALDNIDYMPDVNYSGPGGMQFTLNDLGNTGTGGNLVATATQVITVNPVNDAPTATITPASYSATEQTSLTLHGTGLSIADVDTGSSSVQATVSVVSGTLTASAGTTGVTVSGSGTGSITLTGSVSQINTLLAGSSSGSLSYTINSDTPPATDTLTLSVNDQGNTGSGAALSGFDVATISITAVNDAPINTVYGDGSSVPEDSVIQMLGSVVIADADSGSGTVTTTLSVSAGAGVLSAASANGVSISGSGTDTLVLTGDVTSINAYFASAATAPVFTATADYNGAVSFTVVTTDNGNSGSGGALSDSDTISGSISAVADIADDSVTTNEDTPVTFAPLANDSFENSGRSISAIDGTSISSGQTVASTGGNVTLNANGTLTFTPTANSNGATSFSYTVTSGGATETATVAVTVNAVNDAPVLSFATGSVSYPENAGAVILAPYATVTDADLTNFDGGQLVVSFSANGQAEDRLAIRNQGTTSGQIGVSGNTVTYGGVVIGSFTGGTDGTTPLVISFNSNANAAAVQALGRNITYQNVSDAPSSLVRTLQGYLTDGDGGTSNVVSGSLSITASNDAPVVTSASLTLSEGQTVTLSAANFGVSDPDNTSFTYTVGSVSGGYFQLSSGAGNSIPQFTCADLNSGLVQFVDDGNEVAPSFNVTVNDGALNSNTLAATINYSPVNDNAPVISSANTASVNENSPISSVVYTATSSDADGNSVTWSLSGTDAALFSIDPTTGKATLNAAADYESKTNYSFNVVANDGTFNSSQAVTLSVTNVDDNPVVGPTDADSAVNTVAEDAANGTVVGITTLVTDADAGATISYSLSDDAGGRFAIDSSTGVVTVADGSLLDYETATSHSITVLATSSDGSTNSQSFTINITNLNDNAPVLSTPNLTLSEGQTVTLNTADFVVSDADSSDFTFTISALTGGYFQLITAPGIAITSFTGAQLAANQVQFVDDANEAPPSFNATASDGRLNSNTLAATINYSALNDVPVLTSASLMLDEGETVTLSAANFGVTDPDNASFTYALSSVSGGYFQLTTNPGVSVTSFNSTQLAAGQLQFVDDGNEVAPSFEVTVSDGAMESNTVTATINYTAINDAPVINNPGLTVSEGKTVTLSAANFGVTDPDSDSFNYTVGDVTGGYFQLASSAGLPVTGFTSAQLAANQVQFIDDGNSQTAPSFSLTANDGLAGSTTMAATINYVASTDTTDTFSDIIIYNQKNGLNDKNQGGDVQTHISTSHHVSTDQFAVIVDLNPHADQLARESRPDNQATGNQFILESTAWINDGNSPRLSGLIDTNKNEAQRSSENSRKYHFQSRTPSVDEYRIDSQTTLSEQEEMEFWDRLENIRKQMSDPSVVADANPVNIKIILGTSAGLTAGFVSWILRAGSLMASFMSTVPLLKRFDPLPIMRSVKKSKLANDNEANEFDSVSSDSEDTP
nr:cadherin-like domain-containing protein [Methylomonas fluvii]